MNQLKIRNGPPDAAGRPNSKRYEDDVYNTEDNKSGPAKQALKQYEECRQQTLAALRHVRITRLLEAQIEANNIEQIEWSLCSRQVGPWGAIRMLEEEIGPIDPLESEADAVREYQQEFNTIVEKKRTEDLARQKRRRRRRSQSMSITNLEGAS